MTTKELIVRLQEILKLHPSLTNEEIFFEESRNCVISKSFDVIKGLVSNTTNKKADLSRMCSSSMIDDYDDWKKEDWKPAIVIRSYDSGD